MYVNNGGGVLTQRRTSAFTSVIAPTTWLVAADVDADGDTDVFALLRGGTSQLRFMHCPTGAYSPVFGCVQCPTFSYRLSGIDQCEECAESHERNAQGVCGP